MRRLALGRPPRYRSSMPLFRRWSASSSAGALRGFSLVELVIVVIVIGIVATIALPSLMGSKSAAIEAVLRHDLAAAWRLYEVDPTAALAPEGVPRSGETVRLRLSPVGQSGLVVVASAREGERACVLSVPERGVAASPSWWCGSSPDVDVLVARSGNVVTAEAVMTTVAEGSPQAGRRGYVASAAELERVAAPHAADHLLSALAAWVSPPPLSASADEVTLYWTFPDGSVVFGPLDDTRIVSQTVSHDPDGGVQLVVVYPDGHVRIGSAGYWEGSNWGEARIPEGVPSNQAILNAWMEPNRVTLRVGQTTTAYAWAGLGVNSEGMSVGPLTRIWTSSDSAIASVGGPAANVGAITAVSPGVATITATVSGDGPGLIATTKTVQLRVTVVP